MQPKILVMPNKKWDNYARAIEHCGGVAIQEYDPCNFDEFDGLLLCGGNDVHPSYYGQEVNGAVDFDLPRDKAETEVIRAFIHTGKPILGICRGIQLLNVALGGTLIQDIKNVQEHRADDGTDMVHSACASGVLEMLYGKEFNVNSFHHQAIGTLGNGLVPTVYCGNVIEGVEHKRGNILGVQFHPERMCLDFKRDDTVDGIKIFEHFINLCKK